MILPPEAEVVETAQSHQKALALYRPSAARPMVDAIEARFPDHAGVRYLRAIQDLEDGRTGRALANFRKLLEEYPQSPAVRVRLMSACRSLGDMALLRETLRAVVSTPARCRAWTRRVSGLCHTSGTFVSMRICSACLQKHRDRRNHCFGLFSKPPGGLPAPGMCWRI